jgi:hypothetical protein
LTKSAAVQDRVVVDRFAPRTVIQLPEAMPGSAENVAPFTTDVITGG